jgi:hypothetical protein
VYDNRMKEYYECAHTRGLSEYGEVRVAIGAAVILQNLSNGPI